jgi:hypothetical protein
VAGTSKHPSSISEQADTYRCIRSSGVDPKGARISLGGAGLPENPTFIFVASFSL